MTKKINTGRYAEKTKRQILAEKISADYPIVRRFFQAVFHIVAEEVEPDYTNFCKANGIDTRNLQKVITEPHRNLKVEYFSILVKKYGYSAHWLLTGEGEMK
jgi:ABC-type antimicrobial peptide transport system permease subunit